MFSLLLITMGNNNNYSNYYYYYEYNIKQYRIQKVNPIK